MRTDAENRERIIVALKKQLQGEWSLRYAIFVASFEFYDHNWILLELGVAEWRNRSVRVLRWNKVDFPTWLGSATLCKTETTQGHWVVWKMLITTWHIASNNPFGGSTALPSRANPECRARKQTLDGRNSRGIQFLKLVQISHKIRR